MLRLKKFIYTAIGLWAISTLLIYSFGHNESLQILRGFWPLLSIFPAGALAILCIIAFFVDKPKLWAAWAIFLVALTTVAVFKTFRSWGAWIHFHTHKSHYEKTVKQIMAASTDEERKKICYDDCWLYSDKPVKVAFHYAHGFLNWHDIVYDPTEAVAHPDRPRDFYLVATDRLTGAWFICHFAD